VAKSYTTGMHFEEMLLRESLASKKGQKPFSEDLCFKYKEVKRKHLGQSLSPFLCCILASSTAFTILPSWFRHQQGNAACKMSTPATSKISAERYLKNVD